MQLYIRNKMGGTSVIKVGVAYMGISVLRHLKGAGLSYR